MEFTKDRLHATDTDEAAFLEVSRRLLSAASYESLVEELRAAAEHCAHERARTCGLILLTEASGGTLWPVLDAVDPHREALLELAPRLDEVPRTMIHQLLSKQRVVKLTPDRPNDAPKR